MEQAILETLRERGGASAREIARVTGIEKSNVNTILYTLSNVTKNDDLPPVWYVKTPQDATDQQSKLLIIFDLGNCHFLQSAVKYVEAGMVDIWAYADMQYNGPGVHPAYEGVTVKRASVPHRNAADIMLVWDLALLSSPRDIIIASKDQGFRSVKELAAGHNHNVTFVSTVEELRNLVE